MHIVTTSKEKPTGSANNLAGHIDPLVVPNPARTIKATLMRFAAWLALTVRGLA